MQTGGSGDFVALPGSGDIPGAGEGNTVSYNVTGLTPGQLYAFQVQAVTDAQTSLPAEISATPEAAAASDLVATAATDSTAIHLNWTASTDAVDGYNIYRSTDGGAAFSYLASTSGTAYDDTTMAEGTTAIYYVTAYRTTGSESLPSNDASAEPLRAPDELTVTSATQTTVTLSWRDNSDVEDGFNVYIDGDLVAGPSDVPGSAAGVQAGRSAIP